MNAARPTCSIGAELGEGPVWVAHDDALWFVDITGRQVHRFQPQSHQHRVWAAPERISFIFAVRGGGFMIRQAANFGISRAWNRICRTIG
jgi:D-xylonolactonase